MKGLCDTVPQISSGKKINVFSALVEKHTFKNNDNQFYCLLVVIKMSTCHVILSQDLESSKSPKYFLQTCLYPHGELCSNVWLSVIQQNILIDYCPQQEGVSRFHKTVWYLQHNQKNLQMLENIWGIRFVRL